MHIVDTTLFFAPHSGGVKRYLLAKHRYLANQPEVRHSLLVPGPHDREVAAGIIEQRSLRIPFAGGYRMPLRLGAWRRALRSLAPDVIEVGDPYHLAWVALRAADELGVPAVAFAHSDLARLLASRFGRGIGRITEAYLRRLYARFDLVMAPSSSIAERLRGIGVERVVVQPLGVDGEAFHPSRRDPELRTLLGLPPQTRLLIFAGRMAREKQIPLLQHAVHELGAPYHLLLVGGERLQHLSDRVTLLPYQQDSKRLARLLASADVLVHAGEHETFGMIFIEAMACGIPVIGMRSGAVAELIDEDVGRIAEPGDIASLKYTIVDVFEQDMAALGAAARQRVEQRYTWESALGQQLESYARLHRPRAELALRLAQVK